LLLIYIYNYNKDYERLCRSLNSVTETPQQIKLLWGTIVKRYRNTPDNINSSMISKVWKELYNDKKYFHICHIDKKFNDKIEQTLVNYSRRIKSKQINSKTNNSSTNNKINTSSKNKASLNNKIIDYGISEAVYQSIINNNNKSNNKNNKNNYNNNNNNNNNKNYSSQVIKTTITYLPPLPSPVPSPIPTNESAIITTSTIPINIGISKNNNYNNNNHNDSNINNNNNNQNIDYSYFINQIPSPNPTNISHSIPFSNDLLKNSIQLTTTNTTTANEVCYVPAFQPQYIVSNDNNQFQNIIYY